MALEALDEVYIESIGEKKLLRKNMHLNWLPYSRSPLSQLEDDLLQRGLAFYDQFARRNRENPRAAEVLALTYQGSICASHNRCQEALVACNKALDLAPQFFLAYQKRAEIHRRLGDYDMALADYARSMELNPENHRAIISRGDMYSRLGKPREALKDYDRAIRDGGWNVVCPRPTCQGSLCRWRL